MFKSLRQAITDRIGRPLWKFGARLFPDRPRRKRSWAYLKKAAAVWLGRNKSTIWLYCDLPNIYSADPLEVTGPLAFRGWALSMRGISAVSFSCDGAFVGEASRGISRPDVAALASHLRQSARCGFFYLLDSRALSAGLHELTIKAESYDGSSLAHACMLNVLYSPDDYTAWRRKTTASPGMLAWMKRHEYKFLERPRISLILPLPADTETAAVPSTVRSLQEQVYSNWQLHIISDKPAYERLGESVLESARDDPRIDFHVEPFAAGSEGQHFAIDKARGEFVGLIDAGDCLEANALFEAVYHVNRNPDVDLLYTDEDAIIRAGVRDLPIFRDGNQVGRLWLARHELLRKIDGCGTGVSLHEEQDLLRKLAGQARRVSHVPEILYSKLRHDSEELPPGSSGVEHYSTRNREPVVVTAAPFPMLQAETVREILVVMLDHLGDVLLTFPAVARLREMFPGTRITALVGSWSESLVRGNKCIDDVLTYDFFDASSSKPCRELDREEERRLENWLSRRGFDLAVDFRREPETRDFLRRSRARYTVGFSQGKEAEWLTVAVPYESNIQRVKPRRHVVQELIHLIEMIGIAASSDLGPQIEVPAQERAAADELFLNLLPKDDRLRVAIHPGSGRTIKCWPGRNFAGLADMLVQRVNARIIFFAARSEIPLVDEIQKEMTCRGDSVSLAGRLSISELLAALAHCDLFVGNDSGPTHLAAAAGLPTLCVCSGTIDPVQWAPAGPAALVIHRAMECSPCYLRDRDECPFDVACLRDLPIEAVWEAALRTLLPQWGKLIDTPEFAERAGRQRKPGEVAALAQERLGSCGPV